jgi:competence protein ComFA
MGDNLSVSETNHIYCEECSKNRPVNDLLYIKRYHRKRRLKNHRLNLDFSLTNTQLKGQTFIENCYNTGKNGFIHAVCGAGKTEMCLSTIMMALNSAKSICFVIPRVEIIKQLVVRFKEYLPKTNVCGLYGDSAFDESADLFISTPQQMIRFYKEFDLMMIDEVDAFPMYKNPYLDRLMDKAKGDKCVTIYISATMPYEYQNQIETKQLEYCLIPERFHHKDLVEPKFIKYRYLFSDKLTKEIINYTHMDKRLLVYFPSISLMSRFFYYLQHKGIKLGMISSKTLHKQGLIRDFDQHKFKILLTTTILERGVTFKNTDVFVLESDHSVYDKDTLIQISGRVGRDLKYHSGFLVFYSRYITKAMIDSKEEIKKMNRMKANDMQVMS